MPKILAHGPGRHQRAQPTALMQRSAAQTVPTMGRTIPVFPATSRSISLSCFGGGPSLESRATRCLAQRLPTGRTPLTRRQPLLWLTLTRKRAQLRTRTPTHAQPRSTSGSRKTRSDHLAPKLIGITVEATTTRRIARSRRSKPATTRITRLVQT